MSLTISDEKVNSEAVNLELARNEIVLELEQTFGFGREQWDSADLLSKLEEYVLKACYSRVRRKIVDSMDPGIAVPDYKIELYLRSFVIEPIVEDNYLNVLDKLKNTLLEKIVPGFPLASVALFIYLDLMEVDLDAGDRNTDGVFTWDDHFRKGLDKGIAEVDGFVKENMSKLKKIRLLDKVDLILSSNDFKEGLQPLIVLFKTTSNYVLSLIEQNSTLKDWMKNKIEDKSFCMEVLEACSSLLFDICRKILKSTIERYHFGILKTENDLEKLQVDFMLFCRSLILSDSRRLGGYCVKDLHAQVISESKQVWRIIKATAKNNIQTTIEYKVPLSYKSTRSFAELYFNFYKEELKSRIASNIKIYPQRQMFVVDCFKLVKNKLESLLKSSFNQTLMAKEEKFTNLREEISEFIDIFCSENQSKLFKYFPKTKRADHEGLLSFENRIALVQLACCASVQSFDHNTYLSHLNLLVKIAQNFEVLNEPEIVEVLHKISNLDLRVTNKAYLVNCRLSAEKIFANNFDLDLSGICFLTFGLYIMITGADDDVLKLKKAEGNPVLHCIVLNPVDFKRRKLVMEITRFIKNGGYQLLNFQLIHLIESIIENKRYSINLKALESRKNTIISQDKVKNVETNNHLFHVEQGWYLDYNQAVKYFQEMSTIKLPEFFAMPESPKLYTSTSQGHKIENCFEEKFHDKILHVSVTMDDLHTSTIGDLVPKQVSSPPRSKIALPTKPKAEKFASPDPRVFRSSLPGKAISRDKSEQSLPASLRIQTGFDLGFGNQGNDITALAKLQYLRLNTKKFEFFDLHKGIRSRCPIICLNGFLSEDSDKTLDWQGLQAMYPFTEVFTINWASFTLVSIIKAYYSAAMLISVGSLGDLFAEKIAEIIEENDRNTDKIESPNLGFQKEKPENHK